MLAETLFASSVALSGVVGHYVAKSYLVYQFEKNTSLPLALFILVFMSAMGLLEMLVLEILGALSEGFRQKLWVLFISTLNWTTLFVIPGVLIHKSIQNIRIGTQRYVIFGIIFIFYIGALVYWLIEDELYRGNKGVTMLVLFSAAAQFNFVSKIGVGIISFLSGFSIVYMPFEYFRYYDPLITQINKQNIEETMQNILDDIRKEKMKLAQLALESEEIPVEKQPKGLMSGLMTRFLGTKQSKLEKTIESHKKSIKLNQQMLNGLFVDYTEISREENNYRDSTTKGCWHYAQKTLAVCLLVYGCYKILTTAIYLFLGRNKPSDPISTGLKIGASYFNIHFDQHTSEMIISNASLAFMGILIITNIRGFAITAHKFLRIFFKSFLSQFISNEITLLITTQIIGIYFLSTFFLLQLSLPEKYKHALKQFLSEVDYFNIYKVFDIVLLISCTSWFLVLYANLTIRHMKYSSYATAANTKEA